jgi:hypothetical protein
MNFKKLFKLEDSFKITHEKKLNLKINGWIDVNDCYPVFFKTVLVFGKKNDLIINEPSLAFRRPLDCGGWTWSFKSTEKYKVLYWQPLPEIPKI